MPAGSFGVKPLWHLADVGAMEASLEVRFRFSVRRRPVLTVGPDGVTGRKARLTWSDVERVTITPRSGLVVHGGRRRVRLPLFRLDTPVERIVERIERDWGRPIGSVRKNVVASAGLALEDGDHALAAGSADRDQATA
jgi:hypothetical protein